MNQLKISSEPSTCKLLTGFGSNGFWAGFAWRGRPIIGGLIPTMAETLLAVLLILIALSPALSHAQVTPIWTKPAPPAGSAPPGAFPLLAPDGSAAAPSYSFSSEASGMYRGTSGQLNFSVAGTQAGRFDLSGNFVAQGQIYVGGAGGVDAIIKRYASKQVSITGDGTGATTNAGLILGYYGTSGYGAIWPSVLSPTSGNFALVTGALETYIAGGGATGQVFIRPNGSVDKTTWTSTAGQGPSITAGTATTDVAALSVTRTNNNAAVATGVQFAFTDTLSSASFFPFRILGTSSGTANLLSLDKAGILNADGGFQYGGSNGANGNWNTSGQYFDIRSDAIFRWSSTTGANAAKDTGVSRVSAGTVGVGTGGAASTAGNIIATQHIGVSQTLTDQATVTWDANSGAVATVTLGGNRTMAAPTNLKVANYILHVVQDGTGSRTITWNSVFKWASGIAPTLTTTAAARDVISCTSDATNLYCGMIADVK